MKISKKKQKNKSEKGLKDIKEVLYILPPFYHELILESSQAKKKGRIIKSSSLVQSQSCMSFAELRVLTAMRC
jgi:hypothetical protein